VTEPSGVDEGKYFLGRVVAGFVAAFAN
jgi:hypothetical protein